MNDLDFRPLEAERVSYSGSLGPGKNKKSLCLTSCVQSLWSCIELTVSLMAK